MPIQQSQITQSVLSEEHEANLHNGHEGHGTYKYSPFIPSFHLSLGWELEANRGVREIPEGIQQIGDGSVNGDGREYVVLPSVTRSPKYVLNLLKDLVHTPRLNTDKSCGFHVHLGAQGAKPPRLRQWAVATEVLSKDIETAAFNAAPESRQYNRFCEKIEPLYVGASFYARKYDNDRRYSWLNTVEIFRPGGIRTIEIRLLGHTHRWKYLLAWSTFCMLLGREGWKVAHQPFTSRQASIDLLTDVLRAIETEIKPLEKKDEPVPTWVYSHLKTFGIEWNAFERPLISLANKESALKNQPLKVYSDDQEITPTPDEDNDEDLCACGCGDEGRCLRQLHDDGDCEPNNCALCHDRGNCEGPLYCEECREMCHRHNEFCGHTTCSNCRRNGRGPFSITDNVTNTNSTDSRPLPMRGVQESIRAINLQNVNMELCRLAWETMSLGELALTRQRTSEFTREHGGTL